MEDHSCPLVAGECIDTGKQQQGGKNGQLFYESLSVVGCMVVSTNMYSGLVCNKGKQMHISGLSNQCKTCVQTSQRIKKGVNFSLF